jgi:hypothetical protein
MDLPGQRLAMPRQRERDIPIILRSPPFAHPSLLLEHLDGIADGPAAQPQRPCTLSQVTAGMLLDIEEDSGLARCDPKGKQLVVILTPAREVDWRSGGGS